MTNYQRSPAHLENAAQARQKAYSKAPCPYCKIEMSTGNLVVHITKCLHKEENKRICLECETRIYDLGKIRFCSRSCSATYNNRAFIKRTSEFSKIKTYKCVSCDTETVRKKGRQGKFCSNQCHINYRQKKTFNDIESGNIKGIGKRSLKKFIELRDGINCKKCGQEPIWCGEKLTLDMDHIDGDRSHNHPDNLRLLCPNCHTQTHTWGKKNRI